VIEVLENDDEKYMHWRHAVKDGEDMDIGLGLRKILLTSF